ncbi:Flagellar assembly protein FliH [Andreprevotia sp. IGB-42]|uniref:flagellar assembly protein FliH n=1 Tax=Andreprevotia sp. IGB-42 TaxID=2497473 RepID=UPI00135A69E3|nr:flagellar assembly protein FliH [Andreprevotia sp. IGB-42]KAF0814443.1 Flagellar assembly protein FliH [Andreprevotia sp. IGB-42]
MAGPNQRVIPREQTTAWERWELAAINEDAKSTRAARALVPKVEQAVVEPELPPEVVAAEPEVVWAEPVVPEVEEIPVDAVPLPTAEELEGIRRQAHREGFDAGLEQGRLVAEDEMARLGELMQGLSALSADSEAGIAESVLDLALVLARQLTRTQVEADPLNVLPVIRDAIASLPLARAPSRLYLNPEDLTALGALLEAELPSDVWRLLPDPQLARGGSRIETPSSQLDMSLATRWATQLRVLGRDKRADLAWNAPIPASLPAAAPTPSAAAPQEAVAPEAAPTESMPAQPDAQPAAQPAPVQTHASAAPPPAEGAEVVAANQAPAAAPAQPAAAQPDDE